jgi:hypothetical protein
MHLSMKNAAFRPSIYRLKAVLKQSRNPFADARGSSEDISEGLVAVGDPAAARTAG